MSLWQSEALVLASTSATRKTLLSQAGLAFEAVGANVDEAVIKAACQQAKRTIEDTARELARAKALAVSKRNPETLVLGADQMLECEGRWLDKAQDEAMAKEQLGFLSGKTHRLITAASLMRNGSELWHTTQEARLTMRALSSEFINAYSKRMGAHLLGSVGAYALEELGSHLFTHVEGDHFVILGLPLLALQSQLRSMGVLLS